MGFLSGKRLTVLGAALIAVAAAAAVRVAVSGAFRGAGPPASPQASAPRGTAAAPGPGAVAGPEDAAGAAAGPGAALSAADHVGLAVAAEKRGELAAALAHYRAAVSADPRCVDRRSPGFLGDAFEEKLKGWIAGMKDGRIAAGPAAQEDASFIFRRMYGGCG